MMIYPNDIGIITIKIHKKKKRKISQVKARPKFAAKKILQPTI
jgi:hypothetical protein